MTILLISIMKASLAPNKT